MGNAAKISPCVPSTSTQNAILSLLIIHIIPSRQIYVAMDNPSLVTSASCLSTTSHHWNELRVAENISHAENLRRHGYRCCSHLYKFWGGIQVTWVFSECGDSQG